MSSDPLWIEHAHLKRGAFTKKAKKAHTSVAALADRDYHAKGRTGRQARAATSLRSLSRLR